MNDHIGPNHSTQPRAETFGARAEAKQRKPTRPSGAYTAEIGNTNRILRFECLRALSNVELSQMVVEMLVSDRGPLGRGHGAEKTVRMGRASFWPSRRKPVHPVDQTFLFFGELAIVAPDEALICRHISTDWRFAEDGSLGQAPKNPPDETPFRRIQSSCHL